LALLYYFFGELSFSISKESEIVTIVIFASEAFALAAVLLFGRKLWLGIFIGQFILAYHCLPTEVALSIAIINSLEAVLAVYLFQYFKLNISLSTSRDIFGLIAIIVLILQVFSAFIGTFSLVVFSNLDTSLFYNNFLSWWFGNSMGQILLTPTLLLLYHHFKQTNFKLLLLISLFFALISYIFQVIVPIINVSLLLSVTLPLILYISSRYGIQYATFSVVVITYITLYFTYIGVGIFSNESTVNNLINLNFYFLSQMLLVLVIGTLFEEKKEKRKNLEYLVAKEVNKNEQQNLMLMQQSRLAQMGEVINMIAHQWRQPLNNLSLINDILIYKYEKNEMSIQEIKKFEEESNLQIQHMSHTIDDFRDFFAPRKEKNDFLLNDTIEHLAEIMSPLFKMSEITFSFKESADIYFYGYANEFAQALLNIVSNAKDALIENNISNKQIEIELFEEKNKITLIISDNAGGIPKDIIQKIFDPYFSTKHENEGSGIGLYMSKMIIEKHMNGHVTASNTQNGATFTIMFNRT
jgi:signal transduction histidine kinase